MQAGHSKPPIPEGVSEGARYIECKQDPLVSVIVPIYRVEQWVAESLRSICEQTYGKLEILVINDGSPDESRRICASIAAQDERVVIIDRPNGGLSAARNTGLDHASGEYVLFVDSDDVLERHHVELLLSAAIGQNVPVAITEMTRFDEPSFDRPLFVGKLETLSGLKAVKTMFYQGKFDSCAQAKLYRRELWKDIRFPVGYLHEDLPTTYKLIAPLSRVAYFSSTTYGYRINYQGINHSVTTDDKVRTLDLLDEMVNSFSDNSSELERSARCLRVSFCFHLLLNAGPGTISPSCEKRIKQTIAKDRLRVMLDRHARNKTRAALAISVLGWDVVSWAFSLSKGGE